VSQGEKGYIVEWYKAPPHWEGWDYAALGAGVWGVGATALLYWGIPLWGCSFRWLTGWPCLTCGLTRATLSLAGGHWGQALHYSPLGVFVELVLLGLALWGALSRIGGWKRPRLRLSSRLKRWCWGLGVVLVLLNYAQVLSYHRPWAPEAAAPPAPMAELAVWLFRWLS